jgi:Ala-tRNA(Pro) deacylase
MGVAKTVEKYLKEQGIQYEVLAHPQTPSASRTAQASHITGERIAKAVVLKGEEGCRLAVLPATHRIQFDELRDQFNLQVRLGTEEETGKLFPDCGIGAIPPLGAAYGLEVVLDESLPQQGDVYFEGGDHASLVRMKAEEFHRLMGTAQRGRFSRHD